MAPQPSILAWRIPGTEEPGGLPSVGSHRVGHDWSDLAAAAYPTGLQCRRPQFNSWVGKICWRRERLPTPVFLGFPGGSAGKESACNAGDPGSIAGSGRSAGEGIGYPLWYSGLENSVDCRVHGVTKSRTQLSDFHFHIVKTVPTSLSGPKAFICSNL